MFVFLLLLLFCFSQLAGYLCFKLLKLNTSKLRTCGAKMNTPLNAALVCMSNACKAGTSSTGEGKQFSWMGEISGSERECQAVTVVTMVVCQ